MPSLGPGELIVVLFSIVLSAIPLAIAIIVALVIVRFLFGVDVIGRLGLRPTDRNPPEASAQRTTSRSRRVTVNRRARPGDPA